MKTANQIVFRRLTPADFFNINKPKGMEARGGGQSYIDFPTTAVKPADWDAFFKGVKKLTTQSGPLWKFTVNSIGLAMPQTAEIGQRRSASYNIRAQKLGTKDSNRLYAWHPQYSGFPAPKDSAKRAGVPNLVIYLVRTSDGEYWAGWFQSAAPKPNWAVNNGLTAMFSKDNGYLNLYPGVAFNENSPDWPFLNYGKVVQGQQGAAVTASATSGKSPKAASDEPNSNVKPTPTPSLSTKKSTYKTKSEEQIIADLFTDDVADDASPAKKQSVVNVSQRNQKIVAGLKRLYGGRCQVTGEKYVFKKTDGELYCEAHHLIALGLGGADSPYNIIVVSPLIHRMLHYADVAGLDLTKIVDNKLPITINGESFTITWHPMHAATVNAASKNGA